MAKATKKVPMHFDLPTEASLERTEVLFTLGEQEFKVQPASVIDPDLLAELMEELEQERRNPLVVLKELLEKLLGEEQYETYKKLPKTANIVAGVTKLAMEHLSSAYIEEDADAEGKA